MAGIGYGGEGCSQGQALRRQLHLRSLATQNPTTAICAHSRGKSTDHIHAPQITEGGRLRFCPPIPCQGSPRDPGVRSPLSWPPNHSHLSRKEDFFHALLLVLIPREGQENVTSYILCPACTKTPGGFD